MVAVLDLKALVVVILQLSIFLIVVERSEILAVRFRVAVVEFFGTIIGIIIAEVVVYEVVDAWQVVRSSVVHSQVV